MSDPATPTPWYRHMGHGELRLRRRYETASIINDILVAIWFIAGSILFLSPTTATAGTWMFLLGSTELAIRPTIRLIRHEHLRRLRPTGAHESGQDF